jgi:hypothetical protein
VPGGKEVNAGDILIDTVSIAVPTSASWSKSAQEAEEAKRLVSSAGAGISATPPASSVESSGNATTPKN